MYLPLLQNIALLITLAVIHDRILRQWERASLARQVVSGALYGGATVIGMMTPLVFSPGLIFDGRSIILGVAGLFGGVRVAAVALAICVSYRVWLGGPGMWVGISVAVASAILGVAYHWLRRSRPTWVGPLHLFAFGVVVHVVMLLLMFNLPGGRSYEVLAEIGVPVMLFYPAATWLISLFYLDQETRQASEAAVRAAEQQYRRIIDTAQEGIWTMNADHVTTWVNPYCAALLGYTPDDMVGRTVESFLFAEDLGDHGEQMNSRREGRHGMYERRFRHKDGHPVWAIVSATAFIDEAGRFQGSLAMITDNNERRRAQTEKENLQAQLLQAQKMESVGRLAGGVAHDFNNMLSVIIGHAEMSLPGLPQDQRVAASLREILLAARRSAELTRQLLAFARKQTVTPKVIDLNEALTGIVEMLRRLIGEGIDLVVCPEPSLGLVRLDPTHLDQLLTNLVINARDAITGHGTIRIATRNASMGPVARPPARTDGPGVEEPWPGMAAGEYVILTVADTGKGIDQEIAARIFEPFFTTKEVGKGTGLGLAVVHGVVQQNQGFIKVDSEPGTGTTFALAFPRHVGAETATTETPVAVERADGHATILVVEDESSLLAFTQALLSELGYNVLATRSPRQALEVVRGTAGPIDLLITDCVMPEMNGRELVTQVRQIREDIRCIYISGYAADVLGGEGLADGTGVFLQKPFTIRQLSDTVRQVLASPR